MDIVWIASYPHSGVLWVQTLIASYFHGPVRDEHQLEGYVLDLADWLGSEGSTQPPVRIDPATLINTHLVFDSEHPFRERTRGVVYLLRNPADVLWNNIRYCLQGNFDIHQARLLAEEFIANRGLSRWRRFGIGSWTKNVMSWQAACKRYPHVWLRYEDLRSDPHDALRQMVRLLDVDVDDDRIDCAVERSAWSCQPLPAPSTPDPRQASPEPAPVARLAPTSGHHLSQLGSDIELEFRDHFADLAESYGYSLTPVA